ncbi:hypothetical protein K2D_03010 [Planctomycetes bacterium K2D]|uniref:Uncharacterized protein n=1 Tax=Botrimarina mediterranea TaxID=2528022 RepID=A0A518K321_9BACT|nr:hypothetical protein Spa11_03490 [Botrimarina mediterranea]QDV76720.1 hypothetical protein K2D_03010 [Planctomycetes bacterium K2D]
MGFGGAPNFPATRLRAVGNASPRLCPEPKSEHESHVEGPPYKGGTRVSAGQGTEACRRSRPLP